MDSVRLCIYQQIFLLNLQGGTWDVSYLPSPVCNYAWKPLEQYRYKENEKEKKKEVVYIFVRITQCLSEHFDVNRPEFVRGREKAWKLSQFLAGTNNRSEERVLLISLTQIVGLTGLFKPIFSDRCVWGVFLGSF